MSAKTLIVSIVIVLALLQPALPTASAASSDATLVTLYAHSSPSKALVLNGLQLFGPQQAARLQEGEAVFSLDPPLGENVTIDGTTTIQLWLRSDIRVVGNLTVYVNAREADGTNITVTPILSQVVFLDTRAAVYNYIHSISNLTLMAGSTVLLHVKLTSQVNVGTFLLYDNQATPTQITLPTLNLNKTIVDLLNSDGVSTRVFEVEAGLNATIVARITLIDAIGLYRLKSASLKISDSSGNILGTYLDILTAAATQSNYNATYETSLNLPENVYDLTMMIVDQTGNSYTTSEEFYVAPFYRVDIKVADSEGRPVGGARLIIVSVGVPAANYAVDTNQTGWASPRLPKGIYQLSVLWKNLPALGPTTTFIVSEVTLVTVTIPASDLNIRVQLLGFNLPGANVTLLSGLEAISSKSTNSSGNATFIQILKGSYLVKIQYLGVSYQTRLNITSPQTSSSFTISVPFPHQELLPYAVIVAAALASGGLVLRRRRLFRWPFTYINSLTKGGVPDSRTTTIIGNTGSGKTILIESLAHESLKSGRGCVFVTNAELPSDARATMKTMGMDPTPYEQQGKLIFIDCYSSLSGTPSKEKKSIGSITDLTGLGILITQSIDEIGGTTDVYFDALTPLFTALKPDYVLTFLQSVGAKVKGYNGGLYAIIGTSVGKETLTRVEEVSDCVIETQLSESRSGQRRRLRIKKLRGHPYVDAWTRFIITEEGITFYTRKPPNTNHSGK